MNALLPFIVQALAAGGLITLAALLADQGSRMLRRPSRWIWCLAMLLTFAMPFFALARSAPADHPDAAAPHSVLPFYDAASHVAGAARAGINHALTAAPAAAAQSMASATASLTPAALATAGWLCASLLVAAWLWTCHRRLAQRRLEWREAHIADTKVLLADDAGPAVVGLLRPRIVLPAAMLGIAPRRLASVLAHEQSHIDAGDPRLLGAMLVLLILMPWQALLWYQVARLRRAIEVDCDARVLAAGHHVRDYGAALVDCACSHPGGAGFAAMAASSSFLEQRLRLMMRRPPRWQRWLAPLMLLLAGDVCTAAVAVSQLAQSRVAPTQMATAVDPQRSALAGYYQVGYQRIAVVGVSASGLSMKVNMERNMDLLHAPGTADDDYFVPASDVSVRFDRASHTLRFRRGGIDGDPAPRVDGAAVEAADAWIASRFASQQPFATGAAIIARNLAATRFEQLHASDFTPEFLRLAEPLMPLQQKRAASYGALQEVTFDGVSRQGWDRYKARYANRTVNWAIWVDGDGRLAAAFADDMK
jgi:bla regulator protein BlaR1